MNIYARWELAAGHDYDPRQPALLLEGSWPENLAGAPRSLDVDIDCRDSWIDEEAVRLADVLAEVGCGPLATLNALSLRYYLVKLLRPVAWCERYGSSAAVRSISLHVERERDDDYVALFQSIAGRHGWQLSIVRNAPQSQPSTTIPDNSPWRRAAARCENWCQRSLAPIRHEAADASRVLLCGNPALLDPMCEELLSRGCRIAWLYDRFAWGTMRRWAARGVRQLVCNSQQSSSPPLSGRLDARYSSAMTCRCVDLSSPLRIWLDRTAKERGRQQAGLVDAVDAHCREFRPTHLLLDEDATPLARTAVLACRRLGAASWVLQHGAPRVRFGFSPPLADGFLAWGETSHRLLVNWGVDGERIQAVGSPKLPPQPWQLKSNRHQSRQVLILATVPPNDARPDAVEFHLTSQTHDALLRRALFSAANCDVSRVVVKLHPRCGPSTAFQAIVRQFPNLRVDLVSQADMHSLLAESACVLNCCSSAGHEAAWHGLPVIELLPEGGVDPWPADEWGFFGSARTQAELDDLLSRALSGEHQRNRRSARNAFANTGSSAACAAVDAMFNSACQSGRRQSPRLMAAGVAR